MSISSLQSEINRLNKELADLDLKISEETKKEHEKSKKINDIYNSISKTTSPSSVSSKLNTINNYQKEIAGFQKKKSELQKKKANCTENLFKKTQQLNKEEDLARKKIIDTQKRSLSELEKLKNSIIEQNKIAKPSNFISKKFDFFISHASEDKIDIARPLANSLISHGSSVWYDEFSLNVGDSLRRNIDQGLTNSKFGIVILSLNFFKKEWPQKELDGLTQLEIQGRKVILPIWHKVTKDEVISFSPTLADKVALNTAINTVDEISLSLIKLLK